MGVVEWLNRSHGFYSTTFGKAGVKKSKADADWDVSLKYVSVHRTGRKKLKRRFYSVRKHSKPESITSDEGHSCCLPPIPPNVSVGTTTKLPSKLPSYFYTVAPFVRPDFNVRPLVYCISLAVVSCYYYMLTVCLYINCNVLRWYLHIATTVFLYTLCLQLFPR